jgi:DNA ligase-1
LNKPYEQKRSKYLLKRKEFDDTEFEIIDIFEGEGNRANMAGYATIKLDDGRTCKSNIKGNQEWLKELLDNAKTVKGKMATVRHFKRTPDGIPRFPYVITIRDYE